MMGRRMRHEILYGTRLVRCFADRPGTIDAVFRRSVARHPDWKAMVAGDHVETYASLDDAVGRVAANLAAAGLRPGDRIALLLGNQIEFVYCFLAAARLGLISVPMNTRQRRAEVSFALNQCGAAALVFAAEHADAVPAAGEIATVRHFFRVGEGDGANFPELLRPGQIPGDWPMPASEDTLCLLYTSGTTGKPKGARLTNVSAVHSVLHYAEAFELREGDTSMLAVPISHVTGIVAILLATVHVAGCMVLLPAFKARTFLELAAAWRINFTLLVPAMYNLTLLDPGFASFDLSAWRVAGFGGAPMPAATIDRLADALPGLALCNVYGSTETTSPATFLPIGDIARKPDSVGKPLPCADIVIVDEDGREVPRGDTGELLIGGPMVVPGYWDNPDGDRAGFVAGYWRSGDLGFIDDEGYVYVLDRKKDMINRAGFKVYCVEVESTLAAIPGVVEAAVVGVPDPVLGEKVHAFIVCDGPPVQDADVRNHCAERLSDYKVPDFVTVLDEPLPRNANGKVLKATLRERAVSTRTHG